MFDICDKASVKKPARLAIITTCAISILCLTACKRDWLDAKPISSLVVPKTIKDYQALLDNSNSTADGTFPFNNYQVFVHDIGTDDIFVRDNSLQTVDAYLRNFYLWQKDVYEGKVGLEDWNIQYKKIFSTNIVLEGIEKITPGPTEVNDWNNVKGSALFLRAYNHYDIAQAFCKEFDSTTATSDVGIPLKTNSNINEPTVRSSVRETYSQITDDLKRADDLIPVVLPSTPTYKLRPTKVAVEAMLARVYLAMEKYDSAFFYADKSLQQYSKLLEYNTYSTSSNTPFAKYNDEVIWHTILLNYPIAGISNVDSILYQSYVTGDMRKLLYFRAVAPDWRFKGGYNQSTTLRFGGLATDEVFLIRAECYARKGNVTAALADLNTLMAKRWTAAFVKFTATTPDEALRKIITERRKELVARGIRWSDLRRLNKDPRFATTITRNYLGRPYTLGPLDPRYILPIPNNVILLGGISQNPR